MHRVLPGVSILVAFVLGSLMPGLAHAAMDEASPKVLRIWWSSEFIDDLEPQSSESGTVNVPYLTYEGLTRLDEEGNVAPAAAERWEADAHGSVWTFHLRDGLTYSDGTPLTAERFRYAIARMCDPHLGSWDAESLYDIAGCEAFFTSRDGATDAAAGDDAYEAAQANLGVQALDDRTLEITLRQPAPYFPALTGGLGFFPVRQDLIEAGGPDRWLDPGTWIGNGPFQLAAIEPEASPPHFTFVANERYWAGRPKLDGIDYVIMPGAERLEAYKRGELDVVEPNFDDLGMLEADPGLSRELVTQPAPYVGVFLFNLTKAPFTDQKVREAFAYAFDREAYCRQIERGACTATLSWMPSWVLGATETDAFAYDPARAREALAASAYGGPENLPEIVYYYEESDDPWYLEQAEWIADQFRLVLGVEITLTMVTAEEWEIMSDDVTTRPQLTSTFWYSDVPDPYEWMSFWNCGGDQLAEDIGYCNQEYDALVHAAGRELDPVARMRLVEESQRLLIAGAPAIFGYTWDDILLVKPYVTGYSRIAPNQHWLGGATPLTVDIALPR